jgi:hypothetical protein
MMIQATILNLPKQTFEVIKRWDDKLGSVTITRPIVILGIPSTKGKK